MRRTILALLATALVIASAAPPVSACEPDSWCCVTYRDTTIVNFIGYGDACAGRGPGCTECVDTGYGDSCITNGTYCSPHHPLHPVA